MVKRRAWEGKVQEEKKESILAMYCFSCGAAYEGTYEETFCIHKCIDCKERSVMSVLTAFDILNDLYIKGDWHPEQFIEDENNGVEELEFNE